MPRNDSFMPSSHMVRAPITKAASTASFRAPCPYQRIFQHTVRRDAQEDKLSQNTSDKTTTRTRPIKKENAPLRPLDMKIAVSKVRQEQKTSVWLAPANPMSAKKISRWQ